MSSMNLERGDLASDRMPKKNLKGSKGLAVACPLTRTVRVNTVGLKETFILRKKSQNYM